jgi:hypothetical protein
LENGNTFKVYTYILSIVPLAIKRELSSSHLAVPPG